jgi:hypothetical protein
MSSFPDFKNKNKIEIKIIVNTKLTLFHPYEICQISTNFNFNFNYKSWETGY